MADGDQQRRGLAGSDHYLDMVDLYAVRAARAKTVVGVDATSLAVLPIGRGERFPVRAARTSAHSFRSRRVRLASAATAILIAFSLLARRGQGRARWRGPHAECQRAGGSSTA